MKIIFLDIDGVLNSRQYDLCRGEKEGNIDETRLVLLRLLVEQTDAKIVLTSTWRIHWNSGDDGDDTGKALVETFRKNGLSLFDKTPLLGNDRAQEICAWLESHRDVERFVIFDDIKFGWGSLAPMVVSTDCRIGRGLEQRHMEKAMEILKK